MKGAVDALDGWRDMPRNHAKKRPVDIRCQRAVLCGAEGDRTLNLCIANAALSQLSYRPRGRGLRLGAEG